MLGNIGRHLFPARTKHFAPSATRRPTLPGFEKRKPRCRNGRPRSRRSYSLPIAATHHVCSDWRDEGSKPTRRARVRYVTQRKALGPTQTRARSMSRKPAGMDRPSRLSGSKSCHDREAVAFVCRLTKSQGNSGINADPAGGLTVVGPQ